MTDPTRQPHWLLEAVGWAAASSAVVAAGWGALGGATSALSIEMPLSEAVRMIALGALIAAGVGSAGGLLAVVAWGLSPEAIPVGALAGAGPYLAGLFGPSWVRYRLRRLHQATRGLDDAGQ